MLEDLKALKEFYSFGDYVVYEDNLRQHYGNDTVNQAIKDGCLQHRWIPCKTGKNRCVCWAGSTTVFSA